MTVISRVDTELLTFSLPVKLKPTLQLNSSRYEKLKQLQVHEIREAKFHTEKSEFDLRD